MDYEAAAVQYCKADTLRHSETSSESEHCPRFRSLMFWHQIFDSTIFARLFKDPNFLPEEHFGFRRGHRTVLRGWYTTSKKNPTRVRTMSSSHSTCRYSMDDAKISTCQMNSVFLPRSFIISALPETYSTLYADDVVIYAVSFYSQVAEAKFIYNIPYILYNQIKINPSEKLQRLQNKV